MYEKDLSWNWKLQNGKTCFVDKQITIILCIIKIIYSDLNTGDLHFFISYIDIEIFKV